MDFTDALTGSGQALAGTALGSAGAPATNWAGSSSLKRGASGLYNSTFNSPSMCYFTATVPSPPGAFVLEMDVASIGGSPQDYIQAKVVLSTGWEYQIDIDPFGFGADGHLLFEMDLFTGAFTKKRNGTTIASGTAAAPDYTGATEVAVTLELRIQNLVDTSITSNLLLSLDVVPGAVPQPFWTAFRDAREVV
jgi:hypothetical protein